MLPQEEWGQLKNPITRKGEASIFVSLLVVMIDGIPKTKKQLMVAIGESEDKARPGYNSNIFATLSRYDLIVYDAENHHWTHGKRYYNYMTFVLEQLQKSPKHIDRFKRMFKVYSCNSIDFMDNCEETNEK